MIPYFVQRMILRPIFVSFVRRFCKEKRDHGAAISLSWHSTPAGTVLLVQLSWKKGRTFFGGKQDCRRRKPKGQLVLIGILITELNMWCKSQCGIFLLYFYYLIHLGGRCNEEEMLGTNIHSQIQNLCEKVLYCSYNAVATKSRGGGGEIWKSN